MLNSINITTDQQHKQRMVEQIFRQQSRCRQCYLDYQSAIGLPQYIGTCKVYMLFAARVLTALSHKYQPSLTGADIHTIIKKNTALLGTSPCWQVSVKEAPILKYILAEYQEQYLHAAKAFKLKATEILLEHCVASIS